MVATFWDTVGTCLCWQNHDLFFHFPLVTFVCLRQGNKASAGKAGLCFLSRVPSNSGAGGQLVPAQTLAREERPRADKCELLAYRKMNCFWIFILFLFWMYFMFCFPAGSCSTCRKDWRWKTAEVPFSACLFLTMSISAHYISIKSCIQWSFPQELLHSW